MRVLGTWDTEVTAGRSVTDPEEPSVNRSSGAFEVREGY